MQLFRENDRVKNGNIHLCIRFMQNTGLLLQRFFQKRPNRSLPFVHTLLYYLQTHKGVKKQKQQDSTKRQQEYVTKNGYFHRNRP